MISYLLFFMTTLTYHYFLNLYSEFQNLGIYSLSNSTAHLAYFFGGNCSSEMLSYQPSVVIGQATSYSLVKVISSNAFAKTIGILLSKIKPMKLQVVIVTWQRLTFYLKTLIVYA